MRLLKQSSAWLTNPGSMHRPRPVRARLPDRGNQIGGWYRAARSAHPADSGKLRDQRVRRVHRRGTRRHGVDPQRLRAGPPVYRRHRWRATWTGISGDRPISTTDGLPFPRGGVRASPPGLCGGLNEGLYQLKSIYFKYFQAYIHKSVEDSLILQPGLRLSKGSRDRTSNGRFPGS